MRNILVVTCLILACLMSHPAQAQKPHSDLFNEIGVDAGPVSLAGAFVFGTIDFWSGLGSSLSHKATDARLYGLYGLHYYYQVAPWCQVGVKTTLESHRLTYYTDTLRTSIERIDRDFLLSVMPSVRFTYLNRPWVRLYSGVDLGVGFFLSSRNGSSKGDDGNNVLVAFNITPIGVNVGKKFYGLFELNAGFDSIFKFGIGARW